MKIAYLILAHKDPKHLARLIRSLSTQNSSFIIHIDKKTDITDFQDIKSDNVYFTKRRVPVYYDYSIVEATFIMMNQALSMNEDFDYLIRLAGVDYPVQPARYIEKFFELNKGKEFIEVLPRKKGDNEFPMRRIERYYFRENAPEYQRWLYRFFSRVDLLPDRINEFQQFDLKPYWGNALCGLSLDACLYLLDFVDKNPKVINFFKHTRVPEEMLFQTILGNSRFAENITSNIRYIDWSSKLTHPPELTLDHLVLFSENLIIKIGGREILFANKFSSKNEEVVDQLDEIIREKEILHLRHNNYSID